jgi:hypothetical protein
VEANSAVMLKNVHIWLPSYIVSRPRGGFVSPTHVLFCFVDHYEPLGGGVTVTKGLDRVRRWREQYPKLAERFRDADGRRPQHTFFYPAEEYRPDLLDELSRLCAAGSDEVEIHLHHDNDTAEHLSQTIEKFKLQLRRHGFLPTDPGGKIRYAFIHGNWALDNSRPDGRWCGVNNELQVLRNTGCYADFTLPSAPSECQTRKINSIYYATDDPLRPKSHDTGTNVCVGGKESGDLLLVQGPLALNWNRRKFGLLPRIENADVAGHAPATPARIDDWVRQRIGVQGRPDWIFVKIHTHGCQERNTEAVLGQWAIRMHEHLQQRYNDGKNFLLHYVTARELFNLVKAAEAGRYANPNQFRDFVLPAPPLLQTKSKPQVDLPT